MQILLSKTQVGPDRRVKKEQAEISSNHNLGLRKVPLQEILAFLYFQVPSTIFRRVYFANSPRANSHRSVFPQKMTGQTLRFARMEKILLCAAWPSGEEVVGADGPNWPASVHRGP